MWNAIYRAYENIIFLTLKQKHDLTDARSNNNNDKELKESNMCNLQLKLPLTWIYT